jgi:hypothetical protein
MRAYLMYSENRWFLCFGDSALEASNGMKKFGFLEPEISVSQSVTIEPETAIEIDCSLLAPLFKI